MSSLFINLPGLFRSWGINELEKPQDCKLASVVGDRGDSGYFIENDAKLGFGAGSQLAERALS